MSAGTFRLHWGEFQENQREALEQLKASSDFSDITLACGDGQEIKAHKFILSSTSEFFHSILKRHNHPSPLIYLGGTNSDLLGALLEFMYKGEVAVEEKHLNDLILLGDELKVKGLMETSLLSKDNTERPTKLEGFKEANDYKPVKSEKDAKLAQLGMVNIKSLSHLDKEVIVVKANDESVAVKIENQYLDNTYPVTAMRSSDKTFECNTCGKRSKTQMGLDKHNKRKHGIYKSEHLSFLRRKRNENVVSEKNVGNTALAFVCNFCNKASKTKMGLDKHKNRSHRTKAQNLL